MLKLTVLKYQTRNTRLFHNFFVKCYVFIPRGFFHSVFSKVTQQKVLSWLREIKNTLLRNQECKGDLTSTSSTLESAAHSATSTPASGRSTNRSSSTACSLCSEDGRFAATGSTCSRGRTSASTLVLEHWRVLQHVRKDQKPLKRKRELKNISTNSNFRVGTYWGKNQLFIQKLSRI